MATAAPSPLSKINKCPICCDKTADLKTLPCLLHKKCLECLEKHFKSIRKNDTVFCTFCVKFFPIPSGGLAALPSNPVVKELTDSQTSSPTNCDTCSRKKIGTSDSKICDECERDKYRQRSGNRPATKSSASCEISFSKTCEISSPDLFQRHKCEEHPGQRLEMVCKDCEVVVCSLCFIAKHGRHEGLDVNEAFKKQASKIREGIAEVDGVVEKEKDNLNRRAQHFSETVREAEKQIVEHGEDMKRTIDTRVQVMLQKLDMERIRAEDEMALIDMQFFNFELKWSSTKYQLERVLKSPSPSDVVKEINYFEKFSADIPRLLDYVEAVFIPTTLPIRSAENVDLIGDVSVYNTPCGLEFNIP